MPGTLSQPLIPPKGRPRSEIVSFNSVSVRVKTSLQPTSSPPGRDMHVSQPSLYLQSLARVRRSGKSTAFCLPRSSALVHGLPALLEGLLLLDHPKGPNRGLVTHAMTSFFTGP